MTSFERASWLSLLYPLRLLPLLLLLLGVGVRPSSGQEVGAGRLEGRVFGPDGGPLVGAQVTVTTLPGFAPAVSGRSGDYSLFDVGTGTHVVQVSLPGFQTTAIRNVVVEDGRTTRVDADLGPIIRTVYRPDAVTGPPSTALLRRLAEALDGYRTRAEAYVVAYTTFPYAIVGLYENRDEAEGAVAESRDRAVFGPFQTESDIVNPFDEPFVREPLLLYPYRMQVNGECPPPLHRPRSLCMNTKYPLPAVTIPIADVDSLVIQFFHADSLFTRHTFEGPLDVDALFFSLSAIDKFYVPYITQVFGVHYAAEYRRILEQWLRRVSIP